MTMLSFNNVFAILGTWVDGDVTSYDETTYDDEIMAQRVAQYANNERAKQDDGQPLVHYKAVTLTEYIKALTTQAEREGYRQGADS
jgi:hypothetical protein